MGCHQQYLNMGKIHRQGISSEKETEVMGLIPNDYELNYVCETLNYQYLSHGLGRLNLMVNLYVVCTRIRMCKLTHLSMAYLRQMLEKGGGYIVGISPTGRNLVPIYSNCIYILFCCVINVFGKIYLWEFLRYPYLHVTHAPCTTVRYGLFVRDMWGGGR